MLIAACSGSGSAPSNGLGADAATPVEAGSVLSRCPTSGSGAIVAPGPCFVFTPASAGSDSAGDNATVDHYALEPGALARGELVVFLNASMATPAVHIADPTTNLYATLAAAGFHVLALAYRSSAAVGVLCGQDAGCYGPTRESLIRGELVAGADGTLSDIREDEGILFRLDAALRVLAAAGLQTGWDRFVGTNGSSLERRIAWAHVSVTGHSQGGGHAAYLGRLFALRRVVQLSSTCDAAAGMPAPWTAASEPWATSPAGAFYGLAVPTTFNASGMPNGGDITCAYHAAVWTNMGMVPAHEHDDAVTCTGQPPHLSVIQCPINAPRWAPLFE